MGTDTGLLAHWPLAGDYRDRSGNGHHGDLRLYRRALAEDEIGRLAS